MPRRRRPTGDGFHRCSLISAAPVEPSTDKEMATGNATETATKRVPEKSCVLQKVPRLRSRSDGGAEAADRLRADLIQTAQPDIRWRRQSSALLSHGNGRRCVLAYLDLRGRPSHLNEVAGASMFSAGGFLPPACRSAIGGCFPNDLTRTKIRPASDIARPATPYSSLNQPKSLASNLKGAISST